MTPVRIERGDVPAARADQGFAAKPSHGVPIMSKKKQYTGTSKKGNLQEALRLAIRAVELPPGADRMVEWTLKEVSGRQGGFAGFNEVTVAIEARVS